MKKTAVEFLVKEICKLTGISISINEPCIEQAKEMEKQQIMNAYQQGFNNAYFNNPLYKEQYYKETFRNK